MSASGGRRRLNVGLIGLGRLGRVYARDLATRIAETRLVAVADPNGTAAREVAAEFDAHPQMLDGSGLSRRNRTSTRDVVELLDGLDESDVGAEFRSSLAVAGRTGTLDERMRSTPARDRCRAKTGTLNGVSALAGYCDGQGGSRTAFAFLMNGVTVGGAHPLQDRMAAALARYRSR
jgi:D-alanyl-D-alanine carboxypeptidase/D-alanyl-D-alanine-endopeptidase (penicillin-binding protein 4)